MADKYDVIVIGAGLGGLTAATWMAKHGLSVLLLERHNVPGGYATSFTRGRFEFEIALHELSGTGPSGKRSSFFRYLESMGVAQRLEWADISYLYRSVFPGMDMRLPAGREAFETAMCERFPKDADGIARFLKLVFDLEGEVKRVESQFQSGQLNIPKLMTLPYAVRNMARYLPATWAQVLYRHVKDRNARAVLSQYWGYFGLPPSKVSFFYFALGLAAYVKLGASYPKGRSQALANAFIRSFEDYGGVVRFNCGVSRITHGSGRVTGVITDRGEHFLSDYIVSNADPVTTTQDLIGSEMVPASYFQKLQKSRVGVSSLNVYMGINRSPEELGIEDHEIFLNSTWDAEEQYERTTRITEPSGMVAACYNHVCPEISPPGTTLLTLTALSHGVPWLRLQPEEYVDTKNRVGDSMIRMTEKVIPGIRKYAEVVEVSTPLTNMRYTGNLYGAIYGFANHPWDNTVLRTGPGGCLDGLYQAGAWAQPGGGFQPSMMSGQLAGSEVLRKMKVKLEEV